MKGAVLVTGAAGFVGSHVARTLLQRGHAVVALVRPGAPAARLRAVQHALRRVDADLDAPADVARALDATRPAAAVHAAWYARPGDYLGAPDNTRSLLAAASLFEQCAARDVPVVGVGSCLEYAPGSQPFQEDGPTRPSNLYGACKLAALTVGRALAVGRNWRFAWARVFHVHGPGEAPERLLPSIVRSLRAGREFALSPGYQVRDHLHVADVAAGLVHLAETRAAGVFNVCSGRPVTLRELATTLAEEVGRPELLRFGARPEPPPDARFLCGDPARLRALGWAPARADLRADLRELAGAVDADGE